MLPNSYHGPDNQWGQPFDKPDYTGAGEIKAPGSVMQKREELKKKLIELGYDPGSGQWGYAWIDAMIGDILNKLEELGIADNTLLIFAPTTAAPKKPVFMELTGHR